MNINEIIEDILAKEGGYVNNPADKGGETCWGITLAVARAYGYKGDMKLLPRELAKKIYLERYVNEPNFNKVSMFSHAIAAELVDTGVNMGQSTAATMLQRWLNAFNNQGKDYPDSKPDGRVGTLTLYALELFLKKRGAEGEKVMVRALNCTQGDRYLEITEARVLNETFVYGWLLNRV